MKEITVKAEVGSIQEVIDFINAELEENGCPMKTSVKISVAVDEIMANIVSYAYGEGTGEATVGVSCIDGMAEITFVDSGIPYDPLKAEEPDTTLSAEERRIGGLGIFIVRKTMDEVRYEHRDGKNRLTVLKRFRAPEGV